MKHSNKEIEIKDGDYPIINDATGEVIDVFKKGDKITRGQQSEYAEKYEINFNKGAHFVKLYDDAVDVLRKHLTPTEFMLAIALEKYVSYKDCVLRSNGKVMTMQDIASGLDMDYGTVRRLISSLTKKGVVGIHKTGCIEKPSIMIKVITCNPYIYVRGNDVDKMAITLFEKSGWKKLLNGEFPTK